METRGGESAMMKQIFRQFGQGRGLALFVRLLRVGSNGACNTEATTSRLVPQLMHRHAAPLM